MVDPAEQRVRAPQRLSRPSLSELFPGFRAASLGIGGGLPARGGPPQLAKLSLPAMPSSPGEQVHLSSLQRRHTLWFQVCAGGLTGAF